MDPTAERLEEIKSRSYKRHDDYDSDTRWLLRYVDLLRNDNAALRKRRTSFEHKMFTVIVVFVGIAVMGTIGYNLYVQPGKELVPGLPGCTLDTLYSCGAWIWNYAEPLAKHPH